MAQFKSKNAFLTVHVGDRKVEFFQGVANVGDEEREVIKVLENKPGIVRVDEPKKKEDPLKKEPKPKVKPKKKADK